MQWISAALYRVASGEMGHQSHQPLLQECLWLVVLPAKLQGVLRLQPVVCLCSHSEPNRRRVSQYLPRAFIQLAPKAGYPDLQLQP